MRSLGLSKKDDASWGLLPLASAWANGWACRLWDNIKGSIEQGEVCNHILVNRSFGVTMPRKFRLALAQINPTVGDITGNTGKILDYLDRAKEAQG